MSMYFEKDLQRLQKKIRRYYEINQEINEFNKSRIMY